MSRAKRIKPLPITRIRMGPPPAWSRNDRFNHWIGFVSEDKQIVEYLVRFTDHLLSSERLMVVPFLNVAYTVDTTDSMEGYFAILSMIQSKIEALSGKVYGDNTFVTLAPDAETDKIQYNVPNWTLQGMNSRREKMGWT